MFLPHLIAVVPKIIFLVFGKIFLAPKVTALRGWPSVFLADSPPNVVNRDGIQFSSVDQSCLTLCDPIDCSMPGLSVPYHSPKFAQVHFHCISDVIQLSHSLMPSSPSALDLSQHEGLFSESSVHIRWPESGFQLQYQSFQQVFRFPLRWTGLIALLSSWLSGVFSSTIVQRH